MTKLLNKAIEAVAKLPEDRQNQLAKLLLDVAQQSTYQLSTAESEAIAAGRADIAAGQVASDADIAEIFSRLRRA